MHASHDDVKTWKLFPHYWPFVREIHWSLVDSHLPLLLDWMSCWSNSQVASDLRHHDVYVISQECNLNAIEDMYYKSKQFETILSDWRIIIQNHQQWKKQKWRNMSNFMVSTLLVDGLAPLTDRTNFGTHAGHLKTELFGHHFACKWLST